MLFIAHRINTINELKYIPLEYGVEIDIRDKDNDLILQHDPFKDGELFEDYLKSDLISNIDKSTFLSFVISIILNDFIS